MSQEPRNFNRKSVLNFNVNIQRARPLLPNNNPSRTINDREFVWRKSVVFVRERIQAQESYNLVKYGRNKQARNSISLTNLIYFFNINKWKKTIGTSQFLLH